MPRKEARKTKKEKKASSGGGAVASGGTATRAARDKGLQAAMFQSALQHTKAEEDFIVARAANDMNPLVRKTLNLADVGGLEWDLYPRFDAADENMTKTLSMHIAELCKLGPALQGKPATPEHPGYRGIAAAKFIAAASEKDKLSTMSIGNAASVTTNAHAETRTTVAHFLLGQDLVFPMLFMAATVFHKRLGSGTLLITMRDLQHFFNPAPEARKHCLLYLTWVTVEERENMQKEFRIPDYFGKPAILAQDVFSKGICTPFTICDDSAWGFTGSLPLFPELLEHEDMQPLVKLLNKNHARTVVLDTVKTETVILSNAHIKTGASVEDLGASGDGVGAGAAASGVEITEVADDA